MGFSPDLGTGTSLRATGMLHFKLRISLDRSTRLFNRPTGESDHSLKE